MEFGSDLRISMAAKFLGYSTLRSPFRLQYVSVPWSGRFQQVKARPWIGIDNQYILNAFQIIFGENPNHTQAKELSR